MMMIKKLPVARGLAIMAYSFQNNFAGLFNFSRSYNKRRSNTHGIAAM
jgi:hypothetical protein